MNIILGLIILLISICLIVMYWFIVGIIIWLIVSLNLLFGNYEILGGSSLIIGSLIIYFAIRERKK